MPSEVNKNVTTIITLIQHCVKRVCIRSFSGTYFPAFGVNIPNAGKYGPEKLRIRTLFTKCNCLLIFSVKDTDGEKGTVK